MSLDKHKRVISNNYTQWVSTLPCSECGIDDDTVVAHHLKGIYSPLSGGAGVKASDYFTMPLCYKHHTAIHNGDKDLLEWQPYYILVTLDKAFKDGVILFYDK